MKTAKKEKPSTLVFFGVTGELYKQKLAPALWYLFDSNILPKHTRIIGFGRKALGDAGFRELNEQIVKYTQKKYSNKKLKDFLTLFKYVSGEVDDIESYKNLKQKIKTEKATTLFYLAVPQNIIHTICKNIIKIGLHKNPQGQTGRIVIEKPFGMDGARAKILDEMLRKAFTDQGIFRVDHYIAKETMQHILPIRFGNPALAKIWTNKYIDHIQVIFTEGEKEEDKIEKRGAFYDTIGALRDVGQNHALQMLAAVIMNKPKSNTAQEIQNERAKVLERLSLHANIPPIRGQYIGYLQEPGVKTNSNTETFFNVALELKNKNWKGVPLILKSGKALDHEEMSMEIFFKNTDTSIKFVIVSSKNDAYEKVLEYAILGEQRIFASRREVLAAWKITENIMRKWQKEALVPYQKGSSLDNIKNTVL